MATTEEVETLVIQALDQIRQPYGPDVIEEVFVIIEKDPNLLQRYQALRRTLGSDTLNQWAGKYTQRHANMAVCGHAIPTRTRLITAYSRLTAKRNVVTR